MLIALWKSCWHPHRTAFTELLKDNAVSMYWACHRWQNFFPLLYLNRLVLPLASLCLHIYSKISPCLPSLYLSLFSKKKSVMLFIKSERLHGHFPHQLHCWPSSASLLPSSSLDAAVFDLHSSTVLANRNTPFKRMSGQVQGRKPIVPAFGRFKRLRQKDLMPKTLMGYTPRSIIHRDQK